jgi:hypothetical protein
MVTDEMVAKALALVEKGGGNYEYFFSKLTSPEWIEPLKKNGRFSYPPPMIVGDTFIRFMPWPEGEYLVRMAPLAPEAVFGALGNEAYESDNELVHQILLRIAAELPVDLAAKVARKEAKWASKQRRYFHMYERRAVPVVLNLAAGGKADVGLKLVEPLLHIEAAPPREPLIIDGAEYKGIGKAIGRIDPWEIQHVFKQVSAALVETAPEPYLAMVADKLNTVVEIYVNERQTKDDYSYIWRPLIDSGGFGDLNDTMVSGVRDVAIKIAEAGGYRIVGAVFGKYPWPIFRRLKYYAYSKADNLPVEFIDELVSHDELYVNERTNPEFNDFLSKIADKLPDATQKRLLEIVDRGPDLSPFAAHLESYGEKRKEVERSIIDEWRLAWLTVLKNIAGEERLRQLKELQEKYGPPRPAFRSGARAVGFASELKSEELRKLSIDELIAYLKKWQPPEKLHPEMPSRAGLARELQSWVADDPAFFADNIKAFLSLELHPTFLRSIIDSFTTALKTEQKFDVYKVVGAIEWVLANTKTTEENRDAWDEDPGWSWAHMAAARFLTDLFLHENRLDTGRHEEFWPALELIAQDSFPFEKDEETYREKADSASLALNSTRPVGLEAVMRYLRWLKMSAKDDVVDAEHFPKAFGLLASHLDPKVDNSVAVREMYGMQFSLLCWLDQEWWEKQLPILFAKEPKVLDRFAWNSYVRYSRPYGGILEAMRFRYQRAVNALQPQEIEVSHSDRNFGNHFMQYYAWKSLELDDPLLTSFFEKASPALRAQTLGDVGWHLGQEEAGELDPGVRDRFIKLWEHRLNIALQKPHAFEEEMGAFGWWFASGKFPDDWSMSQLLKVLENFREIHHDYAVVKRLKELALKYPYEAVRALGIIFEEDKDGWAIHGWEDAPQAIVKEALKADEKSRKEAERVINLLVDRGHRHFRNLLK